jgi:tetratricopeptide (TPR) repeat protein
MKTMILALFIILNLSIVYGNAKDADARFKQANSLYSKGEFSKAAGIYEQLLTEGFRSSALHYNLGNTYYRMDETAKSILQYEKALKLDPANDDINFNLQLANLKAVDKINETPKVFIIRWQESLSELYGSGGWAGAALIFIWSAAISFAFFFYTRNPLQKKILFAGTGLFVVLFFICIAFAGVSYAREKANDEAIIMPANVYIKSSPDNTSNDLFILHEGAKVKILDTIGDWKEIKLADGKKGWAPKSSLGVI